MSLLSFLLPMGVIGPWQIVLIVLVVIIFFGGKKIPELMKGLGRGVKEFKDAVNKDYTEPDNSNKSLPGNQDESKKLEQ